MILLTWSPFSHYFKGFGESKVGKAIWHYAIMLVFYMVLKIGEKCYKFHEFFSLLEWDKVVSFKLSYGDWLMDFLF
ncbi:hypothetical protein AAZX31_11G154000 [Glycine max]